MKKIILTIFFLILTFCPKVVYAGVISPTPTPTPTETVAVKAKLSLSQLPDYKNTTNFRLYFTFLATDGSVPTVNLYIQKEGKDWRQTVDRNKTGVSGYFQLEGSDLYDNEGRYNFYATAVAGSLTINSATVTTILDMSAPSAPTEYSKERVNSTTYKLSWKNPFDEDFEKVYVYRSKETSFTADSGTRIGEAGGTKNEKMIFNDGSTERDVEYFYALRAIDHAGNASGVVTDAPGTVTAGSVAGASDENGIGGPLSEAEVRQLPKEDLQDEEKEGEGEIDGGISAEGEEGEVKGDAITSLLSKKYLLVGLGALAAALIGFLFLKKKK